MAKFNYVDKIDYDSYVRKSGKRIKCYSLKKMDLLFPDGNYKVIGEIKHLERNGRSPDKKIGDIKLGGKNIRVTEWKPKRGQKFIQISETDKFIAVKAADPLLFTLIGFAAAVIAIVLGLIFILPNFIRNDNGTPEETHPHIEPIPSTFTAFGRLTRNGIPLSGVKIKVAQGRSTVAETSSGDDGSFNIDSLDDAVYNLVFEYDGSILTTLLDVSGKNREINVEFPADTVRATLTSENDGSPAILVGNLDKEVIVQAESGKTVELSMLADRMDNPPAADVEAIKRLSGEMELTFYNLSIDKSVDSLQSELHKTENIIEVVIAYNSLYDVDTRIFRCHDGEPIMFEKLNGRPTEDLRDGTFYVGSKYLYLYTDKFSTYALGSASTDNQIKGTTAISYEPEATLHLSTGIIDVSYTHGREATDNVKISLYLTGNDSSTPEVLVSESEEMQPGNKLVSMDVSKDFKLKLESDCDYNAKFTVKFVMDNQPVTDTVVDIPIVLHVVE